jgi:hypothetical protein
MPEICAVRRVANGYLLTKKKRLERSMRLRTIAFATSMLLASAGFTASFAQSSAVSEKTFDWIFFVIIGIPFIIALLALVKPGLLEVFIRDWPWERRRDGLDARDPYEQPGAGGTPPA